MRLERTTFVGAAGAPLAAVLRHPDGPARGSALIAHCFTCGKDLHTTSRLASALTREGWLTMTFDFTGLGDSGGDFDATTVGTNVGDLTRAAVALISRNTGPCLLIGHSLGGTAAVLAAERLRTVERVVAIAAPADVGHVTHLFDEGEERPDGSVEVCIGGRPFTVGADFREELTDHDVLDAARRLDRPFLVVEAGADTIVGQAQTRRLAEAGRGELITIPAADHLFSGPGHRAALAATVTGWLNRT